MCNSTGAIGSIVFNGVKRGSVDVAWTLYFFPWCYTWVDVICIWGVVLVLICSTVFIIKLRWDGCLCLITCKWCMSIWRLENRFLECWSGYFRLVIFERTTNFLAHGANEYYKPKIWEMRIIEKALLIEIWDFLMNYQNIIFENQ